jgi:hypothetical protein
MAPKWGSEVPATVLTYLLKGFSRYVMSFGFQNVRVFFSHDLGMIYTMDIRIIQQNLQQNRKQKESLDKSRDHKGQAPDGSCGHGTGLALVAVAGLLLALIDRGLNRPKSFSTHDDR